MVQHLTTNNSGKKAPEATVKREAITIPGPEEGAVSVWQNSGYGRGSSGLELGHRKRNAAPAKTEAQSWGAGEINTLFFPPSNIVPSPPPGMSKWQNSTSQGTKVKHTIIDKVTQLNDEWCIFIENILCVRPCVKYFACFISFKSQKKGNVISLKPSEVNLTPCPRDM